MTDERERALNEAFARGLDYLRSLPDRHVGLTADATEREALTQLADACPATTVTYEPAP